MLLAFWRRSGGYGTEIYEGGYLLWHCGGNLSHGYCMKVLDDMWMVWTKGAWSDVEVQVGSWS